MGFDETLHSQGVGKERTAPLDHRKSWGTKHHLSTECVKVHLKAYANATEARRELSAYFRFYNYQRPHQALGYRTSAEVFNQVTDVGEERAVQAKKSPIDQTLVSLAGAAGLSLNSTSVLSN